MTGWRSLVDDERTLVKVRVHRRICDLFDVE